MSNGKPEGPDQTLVEVWKYLRGEELKWQTKLFSVIFMAAKMSKT